ncbi:hypothetical protein QJS04_geneDACA017854 [Acorus gramineus]|uniref:Uncharacterized protein n=1 Tax=Acorus gramineus TaxID=55184 RepID=A0AAV9AK06_ACOGR|nr:hypothetical protein QJS04_geneDACA017854 [Acorus gramineus]
MATFMRKSFAAFMLLVLISYSSTISASRAIEETNMVSYTPVGAPTYSGLKAQTNDDWICDGRCFLPSCASTCKDRGFHGDSKCEISALGPHCCCR